MGPGAQRPAARALRRRPRTEERLPTAAADDWRHRRCGWMRGPNEARLSAPRFSAPRSSVPRSSVPRSSVPRSSVPRSKDLALATNCAASDRPKAWLRFARPGSCPTCRRRACLVPEGTSKHRHPSYWSRAEERQMLRLGRAAWPPLRAMRDERRSAKCHHHSRHPSMLRPWRASLPARFPPAPHRCSRKAPPIARHWRWRAACRRAPCERRNERELRDR